MFDEKLHESHSKKTQMSDDDNNDEKNESDDYDSAERPSCYCRCNYCFHKPCTNICEKTRNAIGWISTQDQKYINEVISWDLKNNFWKIKKLLIKNNGGDTCTKCWVKGLDKVKKNYCPVGNNECVLRPYCDEHRTQAQLHCTGYCGRTFCAAHCREDEHNCTGSPKW